MADPKTKRIQPKLLDDDITVIDNLAEVAGYNPQRNEFTLAKAEAAREAHRASAAAESRAEAAFKAARDKAVADEQALHAIALGVKEQVIGQFGSDSDEVQAVGRKKKSERKAPTRRAKPPTA